MKHPLRLLGLAILAAVIASPQTPAVGDEVELRARHHLGVPLHKEAHGSNDFDRVPDGAHARVLQVEQDQWFKLEVADGRIGWITKRYIGRIVEGGTHPTDSQDEERVWASLQGCQEVVAAGRRMAKWDANAILIGTWNIRWFSRGCSPAEDCPENATDIDWLACTITWMGVDVLAAQEILTSQQDTQQLSNLIQRLNSQTGGSWQSDLQSCGGGGQQHVGFLWNSTRVQLTNTLDVWQLNPAATGPTNACQGFLRPGHYARASAVSNGVDFNIVTVHLDSGTADRDYQNRRRSIAAMPSIEVDGQELPAIDIDTVILGDFNTMGRLEQPAVPAEQEINGLPQELGVGFQVLTATPGCSEYFENQPGTLDHIVVSTGMSEASATARVTGYCAVRNCTPIVGNPPPAYQRLSDHCPKVMEITNQDVDP